MAAATTTPQLHPQVAALQQLASMLAFCLATPLALWLASTLVLPVVLSGGAEPGRWRAHLDAVAASEARQAQLASPLELVAWGVSWDGGWPQRSARRALERLLPRDDGPSAPLTGPALVQGLRRAAEPHIREWWVLQRAFLAIAVVRGIYCLQLALLAAPAAVYCYALGAVQAQLRQAQGLQPSATRSRWYYQAVRQLLSAIPGCCCLPLALPTVPTLSLLVALLLWALVLARRHAISA